MTERQLPNPRDFADLLKFKRPTLDRTASRLARAQTIRDLRVLAKRVTPKAPFDYTDGAAEEELSLARARQAFRDIEFQPTILQDERVRLTMVNDTMMAHPIHLHGMFFDVVTGAGDYKPRKHTIIVKPGEKMSVDITADNVVPTTIRSSPRSRPRERSADRRGEPRSRRR
jgi:hypothetical protein